ncbi:hypothetical protein F2Q69_00023582 [Brassica cretica]|uniref:Uncharacterized protein n=1 Tax=Brassica cretica TaxID=69181 RepID=A0A8S9QEI9_BRACR|nr:hypothetical protein F2Q69_00023582 [Brassica cretica]
MAEESSSSSFSLLGQRLIRKQLSSRSVVSVRIRDRTEDETRRKSCMKVDLASRWSLIEGIAAGRDSEAKR